MTIQPARLTTVAALVVVSSCGGGASEEPLSDSPPQTGIVGRAPAPVGGIPSIVLAYPASGDGAPGSAQAGPEPGRPPEAGADAGPVATIDQFGLTFSPGRLIARPGETVAFTNSESLPHNVRLHSLAHDSTVFDEDTLPNETTSFTFEEDGAYRVLCDTHPGMTAFIYVTPAPYAAFAEQDGSFHLPDVPARPLRAHGLERRRSRTIECGDRRPRRRRGRGVADRRGAAGSFLKRRVVCEPDVFNGSPQSEHARSAHSRPLESPGSVEL